MIAAARRCAQAAWPKDQDREFGFTKAGVLLDDLVRLDDRPMTLFDVARPKSALLMTALDQVNDMATAFTRRGAAPELVSIAYVDKLQAKIGQLVVERGFLAEASQQLLGTPLS